MRNLIYIMFAGLIAIFVLWNSNRIEVATSIVYDGCYETFYREDMPRENFISFMQDCMNSHTQTEAIKVMYTVNH